MERKTQQKQAILKVIEDCKRPLSIQEIHDCAKEHANSIGIATVYRNLKNLVEEGFLETVELPGNVVLYELAQSKHHHHFSCVGCAKVFDIDGCDLNLQDLTPRGFQVQSHDLLLSGLCVECTK